VLLLVSTGTARADTPAEMEQDIDVVHRLAWLERVIDREAFATRVWYGSWLGFFGGAAVLEGVLAGVTKDKGVRVDSAVNAGKATIAFAFVLFSPARAGPLADRLREEPRDTRARRLLRLRFAEATLRVLADEERDRRGWFPLIGGAVLNAGGAWIDWAAHRGNGALGWIGVSTGLAIAQIQFHTQPTGALRAWQVYQRAGSGASFGDPPPVLRWSIRPSAGGVLVHAAF
jgi:hypothetical protein